MMAKIVHGDGFGGAVKYVIGKKDVQLLDSCGIRTENAQTMTDSFEMQAALRQITKPVAHISLDFSAHDKAKITNALMVEISKEYMQRMGYGNTQYIAVRHNDREHPHLHLVMNRIDFDGNCISDRNERLRSVNVCKEITTKYGLYFAQGKEQVKRHRLKEPDKTKYEIYDAVRDCLPLCRSWTALTDELRKSSIETTFKRKGATATVEGVKFSKNGYSFSGSKIDTAFSYSKLDRVIEHNRYIAEQANNQSNHISEWFGTSGGQSLIEEMATNNAFTEQDRQYDSLSEEERRKRKKRKGFHI